MHNGPYHIFYLKVLQQYRHAFDIISSCETLDHLSGIEDWFDSLYKKWISEFNLLSKGKRKRETLAFAKELDEVTDCMFDQIRDIIKEKHEQIEKEEREKKKPPVIKGFC